MPSKLNSAVVSICFRLHADATKYAPEALPLQAFACPRFMRPMRPLINTLLQQGDQRTITFCNLPCDICNGRQETHHALVAPKSDEGGSRFTFPENTCNKPFPFRDALVEDRSGEQTSNW